MIDELYAWEFNGPFLYGFTGRERPADGGEAGAIGCPLRGIGESSAVSSAQGRRGMRSQY
jgi:hypothetical protein